MAKHKAIADDSVASVVAGIRAIIASGRKPTRKACSKIAGFSEIENKHPHALLVVMAMEPWRQPPAYDDLPGQLTIDFGNHD